MTTTTLDLAAVPHELKTRPQWVCWRGIQEGTRFKKLPYDPHYPIQPTPAEASNPATWGTVNDALVSLPLLLPSWEKFPNARGGGIGFEFADDDPYCGLDFDKCRNPATTALDPWAQHLINRFATYTEVSPSATGVKLWLKGKLPGPNRNLRPHIECYDHGRFFTVTGQHVPGTPTTLTDQQALLGDFYTVLDILAVLLKRTGTARERFSSLFAGHWQDAKDTQGNPYGSQSEADMSFANILTNAGADEAQLDTLWRLSGLYREKTDKPSYQRSTTAKAQQPYQRLRTTPSPRGGGGGTTAAADAQQRHNGQASAAAADPAAGLDTVSPCTHVANAARIAREYIGSLRYVLGRGWIVWTGHYWRTDPTTEGALATGFVSGLARAIAREAATLMEYAAQESDSDRRGVLMKLADTRLKWAVQSENERVIAAGLKLAKPALLIEHGAIDRNPWLFNCQNGTVDLRTGNVQAHSPEHLITHISPATVDPSLTCPTWERFLSEVFAGDSDMVRFMQRALGWSLTGVVQERALFFLYGPKGHNGKTTLVETVRELLGDCGEASFGYARKVDVSTFMKSKNQDDNQRKAAMLAGPRFVYSSEVDAEHRLNEQLIKDITGGDTLEGRHLYREAFTFKPTFKSWMYGNHKPEIRGTDDALWSRVKLVPFEVSFEDRIDLELPNKLRAELSGILNWAIQGCLAWQREGLNPPEKVKVATQQYRLEQDHIAQFIHQCCVVLPRASIKAKRLYVAYLTWCGENGHEARSQHRFGAYLTAHDYLSDENATGRGAIRTGIDLQDPPEEDDEPATLSHDPTQKGSRQKTQQPRGETEKTAPDATLATLEMGKSPTNPSSWGLIESKGRKGSNQESELQERRVNACDAAATLSEAKGSNPRCLEGGNHTLIMGGTGRFCSRCNVQEAVL